MPTVPRIDAPQVSLGGPSNARFDAPQSQNYAARQGAQMGQAMEAAGAEASRIAADMQAQGEAVPVPLAERQYSGEFRVRIPPDVHRALAMQAAEQGVSLNRLASAKLATG